MQVSRRAVGASAALALAVLGGCGGGDDEDAQRDKAYIDEVNVAVQRFAREARELPSGFEAATLDSYSAALDRTATALQKITPPESVAQLHDELAGDVATYADAIEQAAGAPLSEDPDAVVEAQQELLQAADTANREVNRTLEQIGSTLDSERG